ncbi:unnamed protein product [Knipowitschia caucasica]
MSLVLPPAGAQLFTHFTLQSLQKIQAKYEEEQKRIKKLQEENTEIPEDDLLKPSSDLEAGQPLPFIYGNPAPEFLQTPLEDLDPFYQSHKTFIVLGKGNVIYRFNAEPACYLLSPFSPVRRLAIRILIHSYPSCVHVFITPNPKPLSRTAKTKLMRLESFTGSWGLQG